MVQGTRYPPEPDRGDMHRMNRYLNEHGVDVNQHAGFQHPQLQSNVAITSALAALRDCSDTPIEFALMVLQNGQLRSFTSDALRPTESLLFSENFKDDFMHGLKRMSRTAAHGPYMREERRQSIQSISSDSSASHRRRPFQRRNDFDSDDSTFGSKRRRHCEDITEADTPVPVQVQTKRALTIGDDAEVDKYYEQKFKDCQQMLCKIIAKQFVKSVEPKKQTNHPYTGGASKAPAWWPPLPKPGEKGAFVEGVRHKEPDHLYKKERIKLLVWILKLIMDRKHPHRPESTRSLTIRELEKKTDEALQTPFYNEPTNKIPEGVKKAKREILKEIFKVARQQERYKDGQIDGDAVVMVSHGDGCIVSDDEPDEGLEYKDEDEDSPGMPTPDSLVSPHDHHQPRIHQMEHEYNIPMHPRPFMPMEEPRYQENSLHPPMPQQAFYPHPNNDDPSRRASYFPSPQHQYQGWSSPPNVVPTAALAYGSFATPPNQPNGGTFPPTPTASFQPPPFHLPPPGPAQHMVQRPVHSPFESGSQQQQHYAEYMHDPTYEGDMKVEGHLPQQH